MTEGPETRSSVAAPLHGSPSSSDIAVLPGHAASDDKTVISRRTTSAPPSTSSAPLRPADVGKSLIGETLGHFRLEEFIGGGGMGAVFRATDTMLGRTVAVKVVSSDETDDDMLRRFRNEAQSAARLDHPNIARVYYVGQDKGWSYIVFEYIEGVNVRDLVEHKGPLSMAEAVSYTLQVSEALEHAAQRDVVHRDIKPSNILVMPDGRAKLVDMGLARLHQVDAPSQDLTATGVTLGTFDYISPEQARDPRSADVRSDLYSLGCTLYFMLTGLPPFPEGTVLQKLLSHNSEPPPDPRELRTDVDDALCDMVLKLMAKQPAQRFQTPGELTTALLVLSDRLGLHHERHLPVLRAAPESGWSRLRDHVPWLVPLGLLLGIVFGTELVMPRTETVSREAARAATNHATPTIPAGSISASPAQPPTSSQNAVRPATNDRGEAAELPGAAESGSERPEVPPAGNEPSRATEGEPVASSQPSRTDLPATAGADNAPDMRTSDGPRVSSVSASGKPVDAGRTPR